MSTVIRLGIALLLLVLAASGGLADWPQFRGPLGTGEAAGGEPVDRFVVESGDNVRWVAPMPGPSAATPAVVGDRVFVTAFNRDTGELLAIAVDATDGSILWSRDIARGRDDRTRGRENYLAECSPVADDQRVIFTFGTGDVVCFNHAGDEQWRLNLVEQYGPMRINFGYAASPLLHDGRVYINVLRRNEPSYLLCVDPGSGDVLWKHDRPSSARDESREAYATPAAMTLDGRTDIVVYGGDALTGHDPHTGEERWRYEDLLNPRRRGNFRVISGPVQGDDGLIYLNTPRGGALFALEYADGDFTLKWVYDRFASDVPSPTYTDGAVFALAGGKRFISKLDAATGEVIWRQRVDASSYLRASPTVAGGKLYLLSAEGEVFILSVGDAFEQLAKIALGGYPARSTIACAGDALYIRTADRLICAAAGE